MSYELVEKGFCTPKNRPLARKLMSRRGKGRDQECGPVRRHRHELDRRGKSGKRPTGKRRIDRGTCKSVIKRRGKDWIRGARNWEWPRAAGGKRHHTLRWANFVGGQQRISKERKLTVWSIDASKLIWVTKKEKTLWKGEHKGERTPVPGALKQV